MSAIGRRRQRQRGWSSQRSGRHTLSRSGITAFGHVASHMLATMKLTLQVKTATLLLTHITCPGITSNIRHRLTNAHTLLILMNIFTQVTFTCQT